MKDYFGYKGKTVVITGAASGMGAAATEMLIDLGAEVYALDVREVKLPVKKYISVNLLKKDSIDSAIEQLPSKIDAFFNCAGVPGSKYKGGSFTEVDVVTINFLAARHLIETLLPRMDAGSAIAIIASESGMGWSGDIEELTPFLQTNGFEEGRSWLEENSNSPIVATNGGYHHSKECLILYAKARCDELSAKDIRINTLSPGVTKTGMTEDFINNYGAANQSVIITQIEREATAEEMAQPLVFLNSEMATYISGVDLQVDYGFAGSSDAIEVGLPELEL